MKKINFFVILLSLLITSFTFSQDKPKVVEVTGNATIEVQPDIMNWMINVQEDSDDLYSAKNKNDVSTGKILSFLKENNIKDEKISTSGLRLIKNYVTEYSKTKKYNVTNTIWFSTTDFNSYDKFTTFFISLENVFINNTTLNYSKEIETRKQARENALKAAKEKAEMMAAVYGKEIGDPILITEEPLSFYYPNSFNNVMTTNDISGRDESKVFSRGMISITAKVKVVFLMK